MGQRVTIAGFAQKIRDLRDVKFVILRDRSGTVQAVVDVAGAPDLSARVSHIPRESAIRIVGTVERNPAVKLGGVEVRLEDLDVSGPALGQLPIPIPSSGITDLDLRTDWRFLDLRDPRNLLVFEVQTLAEHAMREFWLREGFLEIHSPKLMGSPSESGAELFAVPYFDTTAYLAQSPQFYKQMAMAAGMERVFEIGPVFRANPSFTSRHDTEFTSVDVEISWIDSHDDVMAFEERWLVYVFTRIRDELGARIEKAFELPIHVPSLPFPRIPLHEAVELVARTGLPGTSQPANDLDPAGERAIAEHVANTLGHEFVFLTDYPSTVRPFYHMRYPEDPTKTRSFDLIWKGLEITTGAQREHRYEVLRSQAIGKGLSEQRIKYYLDFFKYGCPPHGGFGFGLTRMLMVMLGFKNVREVTYLYRSPARLFP